MSVAERATYQQIKVGKLGAPGDEGGHLIASIFNGPGEAINLKAMNGNFNKGAYQQLEKKLAQALKDGKSVEVKIEVKYADEVGERASEFRVISIIDNKPKIDIFHNARRGEK
jgi:filamentous hemagglutinin